MNARAKLDKVRGFDVWLGVGRANLKCHRALNNLLSGLDLSLAQHEVLVTIRQHDGLTQNELSDRLLVVKSNVSALIKKLESRGLVRRVVDQADSRNKRLSLTDEGHELVQQSFALQNRVVEAMTSVFSDDDLARIGAVMGRVSDALDALDADLASGSRDA